MGRLSDSVKRRVRDYVDTQKAQAQRRDVVKRAAKEERQAAYELGYLAESRRLGRQAGRRAAQTGAGGGWRGTLGTFASGFEGGTLGQGKGGGGIDLKMPDFEEMTGLGTKKKGSRKNGLDDLLL